MILGLFDSGLGGLTVLKEIINKCAYEKIIYLGDTKRLPYGEKSKEELLVIAKDNIDFLISKNVDEIVVACGTVSSNVLEDLKKIYDIKIIGIIDVLCKGAIKETKNNKIGVIATSSTISTHIFKDKLENYEVYEVACPLFTPLIEKGMIDSKEMDEAIDSYLKPLKEKEIDTLIFGCTHYPLLKEKIKKYFDYPINLINAGEYILDELENKEIKNSLLEFYTSGNEKEFEENSKRFLDIDIDAMKKE